jgi:hypothetical protein
MAGADVCLFASIWQSTGIEFFEDIMEFPIFEAIMLVCFGAAWPMSILKSWRSRRTGGKSVYFLFIILTGYIAGTLHKTFWTPDYVICLYILNGILVSVDIALYYRNRRIERGLEQATL